MAIRAVILDIGNVLLEWDPHKLYDPEIGPDRRKALFDAVDLDGMNLDVDRGAPFRDTIYAKAAAHPDWADEIRMWHDRWLEMATPAIDQTVRLMAALQARGMPVFALSNFGKESFELAQKNYPFLTRFDRFYISAHLKMLKPEPGIYQAVEADCGLPPDALLFTDDRPDNIAAAAARGWQTHLFEGPQGFADRLVAEGLLNEGEAA